ncbi:MAG: hypothetical protein ACWGQW_22415, partial [bacterium]
MYARMLLLTMLSTAPTMRLSAGETSLEDWTPYAQRQALMPVMSKSPETGTLQMASTGHFRCNGSWRKSVSVEPEAYYAFSAEYRAMDVTWPRRSILARIDWKDGSGNRLSLPDYAKTISSTNNVSQVAGHFRSPKGTATATIELIFRWDEKGSV